MLDLDELERKLNEAHLSDGDPSDEAYEVMSSLIRETKAAREMREVLLFVKKALDSLYADDGSLCSPAYGQVETVLAKYPAEATQ